MKNIYHLVSSAICLCGVLSATSCSTLRIAAAGFSGPVYRTDVDMEIEKVAPAGAPDTKTYVVGAGLKYRIVDSPAGVTYIKMIPTVGYNWQRPAVVPGVARTSEEIDTDRKVEKAITARTTADASAKTAKDTKSDANTATAKAEKAEAEAAAATISLAKAKVTRVNISLPEDKEPTAVFEEIEDHELFKANETNLATYNKVIVNQVVLGGMLLPIKIRPAREFNGVQYERHFATDVSVGPFVGYRFKFKGNNYNSFTTLGLFAGPTLIDYVSTVSQTGSPTNGVNPDNMFAFTYGIGLVHEINGFQMGIVYGSDRVSGKRVKEWPYDGDGWFSLAIGYNFLSGRVR